MGMPMHDPCQPLPLDTLTPADASFFDRDPRKVARDLLGMLLVSRVGGIAAGGRIAETEAYLGSDDPGSHAATKGITKRNVVMYGPPGSVYVYFTYGNHHMVNLVCCAEGIAGAVLVRAIEPLVGVDEMRKRRGGRAPHDLANGPGKLAEALGVDLSDNGSMLGSGRLVVYHWRRPAARDIAASGRVGLSFGHELEHRYFVRGDPFVSRARTGELTPRKRDRRRRKDR